MKLSIITVTLNSARTIRDTLNSVLSQSSKSFEHIIVDGGSNDGTLSILKNYPYKKKKVFLKKNYGIYKAINFAIKKSKGEYIIVLNSDDIFNSNKSVNEILRATNKFKKTDIILGNVAYFNNLDYSQISRFYSAQNFQTWKMKLGLMPPHPASIIKRKVYLKYGLYLDSFKIAGDFELFLRFFFINKLAYKKVNKIIVRMRTGGVSGKSLLSYWISTFEIIKSFKINNLRTNLILILIRIPAKINQLIFYDEKKLNLGFKIFNILFDKDYYLNNSFKIIRKFNTMKLNNNFILSGMNLAFMGYYSNAELYPHKSLYHWPDGVWVKKHINIEKLPGRDLINQIKLDKYFNKILVLGNLSKKSKDYLKKKFKVKVYNQKLPFGSIEQIKKTKIKLTKNTLTFITLPTPKQEKLAYHLSKKNAHYKIICIGASIGIASGDEKAVPHILRNYEFLWRLKSDFLRRFKRIIETLIYYLKGKHINKIFDKTRFINID